VFFTVSKALSSVTGPWFWALALFALAALLLYRRSRRAGLALAAVAAALPVLFASPRVADTLQWLVESSARDTSRPGIEYDAAVVLGGGDARVAAAAEVFRRGRARSVLYSGAIGARDGNRVRAALRRAGVPDAAIFIEDRSRNTRENAVESSRIIAQRGWRSLLLITSAAHVERALGCFRDVGLNPDALPAERVAGRLERDGWLPRRQAIPVSRAAVHEFIGRVMYRVMGYTS
jgi:uncharacterized SAM-binding protein YcdF (DUF218 family)